MRLGDPKVDITTWTFIHNLLTRLGQAGMSSDESDKDEAGRPIYRVKILAWRKDIDKFLKLVDDRRNDTGIFSHRGSKGRALDRLRGSQIDTRRPALPGLPLSFYADSWLKRPGMEQEMIRLTVSEEEFCWMKMVEP